MEPQHLEERLNAIDQKIEEVRQLVLKTRQVQKRGNTVRMLYWVFIILLGFGAFYFIQPVLGSLKSVYGVGNGGQSNIDELFNQLNGQQ